MEYELLSTTDVPPTVRWNGGIAPVAVVMISLNEGHNLDAVLKNVAGWAQEVFLVDSYSQDDTVDIALHHGVHVVQRPFRGFGDQWNFALNMLPISAPWTMKLDPDERLSDELKANLFAAMQRDDFDGASLARRLWFMSRPLPVRQSLVRLWRTGACRFTDVSVNEHPIVQGHISNVAGEMEHHDSPDLDHWLEKQNRYTTAEAVNFHRQAEVSDTPRLIGTALQRRMWLKVNFHRVPGRYLALFLYHLLVQGAWRAGWVGVTWCRLRVMVMRLIEYKWREIELTGRMPVKRHFGPGKPDARVAQFK
jgi:glycosyltransferase involved in cell wall biosynthesis